jgi:hypothetical protein
VARQDLALVGSERKQSCGQEGEVDSRPAQASDIRLRDVEASDIEIFYDQQLDPEATAMAAFPARDRESHLAHWNTILKDSSNITRTIVAAGQVAGNIGSWVQDEQREIGYSIGKATGAEESRPVPWSSSCRLSMSGPSTHGLLVTTVTPYAS